MHLIIHWLTDLRHEGASTFGWETVKSNLGAWPYQAALAAIVTYAFWPKVRVRVDAWVKGHLHHHNEVLKTTLADHHDAVKASLAEHHETIRTLLEEHQAKQ